VEFPNIAKFSPHLNGMLRRSGVREVDWIDRAFAFSMDNGGWLELDFDREPGVSFNPRPARIGLILLNDAKVTDGVALTAGVLATAHADLELIRETLPELPPSIAELAILAQAEPEQLEAMEDEAAGTIAATLHLDRARHRHLVRDPEKLLQWEEFLHITDRYTALAERVCPRVAILLTAWYRRANPGAPKSRE